MKLKNPLNVEAIAELINGRLIGNTNTLVSRLNRIESCEQGDITFFYDSKYAHFIESCRATCILVPDNLNITPKDNQVFISVQNPYFEFYRILKYVESLLPKKSSSIHNTAIIGNNTKIDKTAYIGPYCVIGDNCTISENVVLHSKVVLYDNVSIESNSLLNSSVICYSDTIIGKNCILQAGAVIGSDGFGFIENKDSSYEKIPQLGNVVLEDNVEIGANTTIDRALIGSTIIEKGCKIDNLCQIAHNVSIGENTGIAAQVGISGSTKVGKRNRLAGQVGLAGHISTVDDVILYAQSGVGQSIEKKGIYFGAPARERFKAFKIEAVINDLPDLFREFYALKRKLEEK